MAEKAIIVGSQGQDGRLLSESLASQGFELVLISRSQTQRLQRGQELGSGPRVDIESAEEVARLVADFQPDQIYYLAAFHHSSQDAPLDERELFMRSNQTHTVAPFHFLDAIRQHQPRARFFYAASSLIYGQPNCDVQNETTPFRPDSVYGITKLAGLQLCAYYREKYGVFASGGILFNHESHYRAPKFLTRKVVLGAIEIQRGTRKELVLGDLDAEVDWGYAPDYIEAMQRILATNVPDDFVIATGLKHSVRDFVEVTFRWLGLDWKAAVRQDGKVLTRRRAPLLGEAMKLRQVTGWKPETSFEEMIRRMLKADGAQLND